jgi:hypothetical protein
MPFQCGIFIAPCKDSSDATVFNNYSFELTPTAGVDLIKRPVEDAPIGITPFKLFN